MNLTKTRNTTKYLAIKGLSDENKTYSISALCEFAGIARSAYYKWLGHVNSDNDNLNERIADTITRFMMKDIMMNIQIWVIDVEKGYKALA